MSQFIVQCLNPYRKPDCKVGRITTTEDFKHLARKLTHGVMNKELKYCKNPEDLECNENVKHKTKEYIKKYMQKFGAIYKPKE
ncbi:SETD2 methyltransferase, partial [Heliornis fulica]|nr:SETD2 methyltransferase [Heliornis fulica]